MTQVSRLVEYVRTHPGCTGLEIVMALAMPKYTSRASDARDQGYDIYVAPRPDGRPGYHLRERRPVTQGVQEALAL